MNNQHLIDILSNAIRDFEPQATESEAGEVVRVGDGVVEITGLRGALLGELLTFDLSHNQKLEKTLESKAVSALVLNLEENMVKAVVLGDSASISEGMLVMRTKSILSIPVGDAFIGRVVDTLGVPQDARGAIQESAIRPIERDAYGVIDRSAVNTPLHTGIPAVDAMIPIGRGQRELIIGDRGTGKTAVALDTILNQKNEPKETRPICIYVAIGQKESKTARLVERLREEGALEYTIVVSAPASAPAALQFLAPFTGATLGEYFMEQGKDALVVYDDLSKQAVAYRQMSLLLRRPPGREAYPGDIFYLHSRLLERAAKLSKEKGGGSLTALPIIETQENDVSAYIPTNVISITDGQIYLESELFNKGIRPAINVGISVSRVGSSAQTKAMKKVAGKVRLELAQYRELEAFSQFAQDLDEDTKTRIASGRRLTELLIQKDGSPLPFEEEVVLMYLGTNGAFDHVEPTAVRTAARACMDKIRREDPKLLDDIRTSRDLTDEVIKRLAPFISHGS
jgi:F-type H+-transporting ATPase subunit alpha